MGVQFWWFYDVIAVAVILVSIFLSVRKGLIKTIAALTGFVLSAVIAFSAGGPIAELMYEQSEKGSNIILLWKLWTLSATLEISLKISAIISE